MMKLKPFFHRIDKHLVNYSTLEELLALEKWYEADCETTNIQLSIVEREEAESLYFLLSDFPCEDLVILDQLWVKYSCGCFGFSVQKRIYQEFKGSKKYTNFCEQVGWRENGHWKYPSELIFSLDAPEGHLPWLTSGFRITKQYARDWCSRLEACGL